MISRSQVIVFPHSRAGAMVATTARDMMSEVTPVAPDTDNEAIFARFEEDSSLLVVPVIGDTGKPLGLMTLITDMQITAARYANPLTQLPGNVPINEHIDRLIGNGSSFVACYCDLDHFKPYNDHYGYRQGDQLIQLLGSILSRVCDPRLDFVGHIGGDDFMLLMQSDDWQQKLAHTLHLFADGIGSMSDENHRQQGGYWGEDRRGNAIFHALPTLSIGCLIAGNGDFHSHHEVSAAVSAAKKQAKKINGNSLFVERRNSPV